jgi:hypothetical protein
VNDNFTGGVVVKIAGARCSRNHDAPQVHSGGNRQEFERFGI